MLHRSAVLFVTAMLAAAACGGDDSTELDELMTRDAPGAASAGDHVGATGRSVADSGRHDATGSEGPDDAAGASDGPAAQTSVFMPTPCPFEVEVDLTVVCGVVQVPEARDPDPRGRIELAVAILRTPAVEPSPDPVVHLAGGPGGVSLAEHFIWLSGTDDWTEHPILAQRDLVLVDQRGTGYSYPSLWCDEDHEGPEECHQRLLDAGVDLSAYSTQESAADLADVRRALGIETWNLHGSSYGTRLALTVLRDHPEGVRSLVLEGIYPPDVVPAYHEYVDHALRALDEMVAACATDTACATRFGDVGDLLLRALRAADETPGAPADALDLMDLVFGAMYHVEGLLDLPLALELAATGNLGEAVDVLLEGAPGFSPRRTSAGPILRPARHDSLIAGDPTQDSAGLFHSIECREEIAFTDLDTIARRADQLFTAGVDGLLLEVLIAGIIHPIEEICPWWDSGRAAPEERSPAVSDIPVLLLSGRFDPITPPAWGDRAASTLSRATHVVAPNLSHSLILEDPCIDSIVGEFLADPSTTPDTGCTTGMSLPPFTLG